MVSETGTLYMLNGTFNLYPGRHQLDKVVLPSARFEEYWNHFWITADYPDIISVGWGDDSVLPVLQAHGVRREDVKYFGVLSSDDMQWSLHCSPSENFSFIPYQ